MPAKPYLLSGLAAVAVIATTMAAPAHAQQQTYSFDIPAQELDGALRAFAQTTRAQVIFDGAAMRGKRSRALKGAHSADQAIVILLRGSGMSARRNAEGVLVVARSTGVAQNSPVATQTASSVGGDYAEGVATESDNAEIVVTGTNIRGQAPVGSPLTVVTRQDIERSGYARVQDYLEMLPQNFSGSASEDSDTDLGVVNFTGSQAVDLRGLGASSTLILVNGRRQAAGGGLEGAFVDISSIPTAAIERVEILTDGASALYGSDAVGGVVNFVLRKDFNGLEASARLASTDRFLDEWQIAFTGGRSWDSGNILFSYSHLKRDSLECRDRAYCRLNRDYRPLGGNDRRAIGGNPGTITRAGQPNFAIPVGQDGTALTPGALLPGNNYQDAVTDVDYLPRQDIHSLYVSLEQRFGSDLTFFADARYGMRNSERQNAGAVFNLSVPATNPFYVNPYAQPGNVQVRYDFSRDLGVPYNLSDIRSFNISTGANYDISQTWRLSLVGTYAREKSQWDLLNNSSALRRSQCLLGTANSGCPGRPLNVFGDGAANDPATLQYIREDYSGQSTAQSHSATLKVDGALLELPAGPIKVALGGDYREESLDAWRRTINPGAGTSTLDASTIGEMQRVVKAAFGEVAVPLSRRANSGTGVEAIVTAAARYEHYSDFGSTFDPKFGVQVSPLEGVIFRGSWSSSFRAPRFNEISPVDQQFSALALTVPDPQSGTGVSTAILLLGANPNLGPETATNWTAGFDIKPSLIDGLSLGATYFDIRYKNKIRQGGEFASTLNFEARWQEIIKRNPSAATVNQLCNTPGFQGACPTNVAALIDIGLRNIASVETSGIDFYASYTSSSSLGTITGSLAGTYLLAYDLAVSSTADNFSQLNTVGNPLRWRVRGGLSWQSGPVAISSYGNYTGSYRDPDDGRDIRPHLTFDASVRVDLPKFGLGGDNSLSLSAINLFNRRPPFVDRTSGFDPANANQNGRTVSITLRAGFR